MATELPAVRREPRGQVTVRCAVSEAALVNNREMPDKFAALDSPSSSSASRMWRTSEPSGQLQRAAIGTASE